MIGDLYSPDSFDTRLGEWASANVQPCDVDNHPIKIGVPEFVFEILASKIKAVLTDCSDGMVV